MGTSSVILDKSEHVAVLTLNRPNKLNAIDHGMKRDLRSALQAARNDDGIRALVITGGGRGFCSGADIAPKHLDQAGGEESRQEKLGLVGEFILEFEKFDKPVVAAVNGVAAGIGLTLALVCDLRIASVNARFSAIWVKRGLIPDGGATLFLPSIVGLEKTLELTMTGNMVDAAEARKIGLVSRVVSAEELLPHALELCNQIASQSPIAVELTKRLVMERARSDWRKQLMLETYAQNQCRGTNDHKEALASFHQKRTPIFTGT